MARTGPPREGVVWESPSQTGYNRAMAVAAPNTPATSTTDSRPRRPRFQFSLRTALLAMLVLSLLAGAFAWRLHRAERQRKIVAELRELGVDVEYSYFSFNGKKSAEGIGASEDEFFLCTWIRRAWGDDFVYDVDKVWQTQFGDSREIVELVKKLPQLRILVLADKSLLRKDLEEFAFLESLESLQLSRFGPHGCRLTDDDLIPLEQAVHLQDLGLSGQPITDRGVAHLRNCHRLQKLNLSGTKITDEGLKQLRGFTELKDLRVDRTQITDAGLESLKDLQQLEWLGLAGNNIRGDGLVAMGPKAHLWSLDLARTKFDDNGFRHLALFPQLSQLGLENTQVTAEGVKRFQAEHPLCPVSWITVPPPPALAPFLKQLRKWESTAEQ
jgi:hypothetical protein